VAARVLQFGWDDCHRGQVLEHAGYLVTKAETLKSLSRELQMTPDVAAVVLSENDPRTMEQAAEVVRRHSKASVILFRRSSTSIDERKFDQVYYGVVTPDVWLPKTAELIAHSIDLQERSVPLRLGPQMVPQMTEWQRARLPKGLARNKPPRP
jgi:hypothetical protein